MLSLQQCLLKTSWPEVSADLRLLFPEILEGITSLEHAYQELIVTEPESGDIRITIGQFAPNGVLPFYIVGYKGDCPKGYCLKFIPWHQWLGASIDTKTLDQYSYYEIIAICLNEMCWAGFSSDNVVSFRREFIHHENCLEAIFGYEEQLKLSEFNLIKCKQRSNEFNEALNLHDFDNVWRSDNENADYREALFEMNVQVYCLGETLTDYDEYCAKVARLREDFQLKWSAPQPQPAIGERCFSAT
ncbi:MAG: DUF6557 family protein [Burkholderiaceae bacterium]